MKFRLFEFEDKTWLPAIIREGMMDYLRFILNTANLYQPVSLKIVELLAHAKTKQVIDLCSGGGGTIEKIQQNILNDYQQKVPFVLTDIFPNSNAYKYIQQKTQGKISFVSTPVNAANVDVSLVGVRTIFSAFHHFDESVAAAVLKNAVTAKEPIGIFDGGDKNIFFILLIIFLHPIAFFVFTPFFRPFKWSRLLFTYIIPIIPLCAIWDGIVSITHLYTPTQLIAIATQVDADNYHWEAGKLKNKLGMRISFLTGFPK